MRHLTHGILQDPNAPDKFYFSPGRVLRTIANMLAEQQPVDQDFAAVVAGELVCQAVQAEVPAFVCERCQLVVEHYENQRFLEDGRAVCLHCFLVLGGSDADVGAEEEA